MEASRNRCSTCRVHPFLASFNNDGCFRPQKSPPLVLLGGILPFLPSDLADACDARHLATFLGVLIMLVPVQTSHVSARRSLSAFFVSQFFLASSTFHLVKQAINNKGKCCQSGPVACTRLELYNGSHPITPQLT